MLESNNKYLCNLISLCFVSSKIQFEFHVLVVMLETNDKICTWYNLLLRINAGGVHLIYDIFFGAFIQGRRLHEGGVYYKIQRELQFYIYLREEIFAGRNFCEIYFCG